MKKKIRISYNAPVILSFVLMCCVVMAIGMLTGGKSTEILFMTYHSSLRNPLTYLRFLTHIFGHAGWSHLFSNATYLLLLGPMLEEKYGTRVLVEIIAVTAVVTGIVNYVFFWNIGLCGASGVAFAFIIMASFTRFKDGEIPLTFILVAVIYIGQQIFEGITISDNVSNMAHIVGGLVGAVIGYALNKKSKYSLR